MALVWSRALKPNRTARRWICLLKPSGPRSIASMSGPTVASPWLIETALLNWMMDRLSPGGTFLDIGASAGATALPTAHRFGPGLRVIANEPATA